MKAKHLLTSLLALVLVSCTRGNRLETTTYSSTSRPVTASLTKKEEQTTTSSKKDTTSVASLTTRNTTSKPSDTTARPKGEGEVPNQVTVFSINDLHGSIEMAENYTEPGLARLEYAIKHDADYDPESSLIISAGDSWQGGYLSYEDKYLTDILLSDLGIKAMALGNHEFDWGTDMLETLSNASPFPILGANVKDENGNRPSFLKPSTIVDIGSVRYGIIGTIGSELESDISTSSLGGYSFDDNLSYIDTEITSLKNQDCDIIVLAVHDDAKSDYVTSIGAKYTSRDLAGIFGGHSHSFQNQMVGNLPYVQARSNSWGYSKMTFNTSDQSLVSKRYVDLHKDASIYSLTDDQLNQDIVSKISLANQKYHGDITLATFQGNFTRSKHLRKFIPDAMVKVADGYGWGKNHGGHELIAIQNLGGIRADLFSGPICYKDVFKVSPFDNEVRVSTNVSGSKISKLLGTIKDTHTSSYYAFSTQTKTAFSSTKTYDVVTIDYVSTGSYWNNSIGKSTVQYNFDKADDSIVYARDAIVKFMMMEKSGVFNAADYNF